MKNTIKYILALVLSGSFPSAIAGDRNNNYCDLACNLEKHNINIESSGITNNSYQTAIQKAIANSIKNQFNPLRDDELIKTINTEINNVQKAIVQLDKKINDLTLQLDEITEKRQTNLDKLTNLFKNKKNPDQLKAIIKKLNKLKYSFNQLNGELKRNINLIEQAKFDKSKLLKELTKKNYELKSQKYQIIKNGAINIGVGSLLSGVSSIIENNQLSREADELQAIFPELTSYLSIGRMEYWGRVGGDMLKGAGTASIGLILSHILKTAGRGTLFAIVTTYFSDIPTNAVEIHEPMPDHESNKKRFFQWLRVMAEHSERIQEATNQDKTGENLTIPLGILQYWQLIDMESLNPDPNMAWIHNWKVDSTGKPFWQEKSKLKQENNFNQLINMDDKLYSKTSEFGVVQAVRAATKIHAITNMNKTVQENPYLAKGSAIIEAPADIVLNWGNRPADLDSHLTGPINAQSSERFHVNYQNKGSLNSNPNVLLYRDDTSHGAGSRNRPEQTRINVTQPGVYNFYVHDFSNKGSPSSRALSNSGAVVSVHTAGNRNLPEGDNLGRKVTQFTVPKDKIGTVWHTFELDTRRNTIKPVNTFHNDTKVIK